MVSSGRVHQESKESDGSEPLNPEFRRSTWTISTGMHLKSESESQSANNHFMDAAQHCSKILAGARDPSPESTPKPKMTLQRPSQINGPTLSGMGTTRRGLSKKLELGAGSTQMQETAAPSCQPPGGRSFVLRLASSKIGSKHTKFKLSSWGAASR
eukprot:CAMPEP_0184325982 /NCGR_PEP_ID=MMETSP1049-20130417/142320_1 /TAXON_ID=77928 /ORGANISM="Proteomonas sulcata, Strain CCMP704" /LENGTH=155 /DNA_ID=CAMNT_0026648149 /DNA_START=1172 /DNA_END=1638 /DNA_ORIENTATION=+